MHGARMSKTVGRNPFLGQRGLFRARNPNVLCKNVFEPRSGHCLVVSVQEQRCTVWLAANFEPIANGNRCFLPQGKHTLTAAFAYHMNGRSGMESEIGH